MGGWRRRLGRQRSGESQEPAAAVEPEQESHAPEDPVWGENANFEFVPQFDIQAKPVAKNGPRESRSGAPTQRGHTAPSVSGSDPASGSDREGSPEDAAVEPSELPQVVGEERFGDENHFVAGRDLPHELWPDEMPDPAADDLSALEDTSGHGDEFTSREAEEVPDRSLKSEEPTTEKDSEPSEVSVDIPSSGIQANDVVPAREGQTPHLAATVVSGKPEPAGAKPVTNNPTRREMSNVEASLKEAAAIDGAVAVALVDYTSGMSLGSAGDTTVVNLDVAAAGNTDVVRAKLRTMEALGLKENIEDILITLNSQYHLIRLLRGSSGEGLFLYLVLDKGRANLAMARHKLSVVERNIQV